MADIPESQDRADGERPDFTVKFKAVCLESEKQTLAAFRMLKGCMSDTELEAGIEKIEGRIARMEQEITEGVSGDERAAIPSSSDG